MRCVWSSPFYSWENKFSRCLENKFSRCNTLAEIPTQLYPDVHAPVWLPPLAKLFIPSENYNTDLTVINITGIGGDTRKSKIKHWNLSDSLYKYCGWGVSIVDAKIQFLEFWHSREKKPNKPGDKVNCERHSIYFDKFIFSGRPLADSCCTI